VNKNFGDFFNLVINLNSNNLSITDVFFLYSDRGEYIGKYKSLEYNIAPGIYFISHQDNNKGDYLRLHKLIYPFINFLERVEFYIDKEVSNKLKEQYTVSLNNIPRVERGGHCYVLPNKKLGLEKCINCKSTLNSMDVEDFLDINKYPKIMSGEIKYSIASWHVHPLTNNNGANANMPSGIWNFKYPGIAEQYTADIGLVSNMSFDRGCLLNKNQVVFHKISGGIGLISSLNGITIYRHTTLKRNYSFGNPVPGHKNYIYEMSNNPHDYSILNGVDPCIVPFPEDNKYYGSYYGKDYDKFSENEHFNVIDYDLSKIIISFKLTP
jgi:hypothetical protein